MISGDGRVMNPAEEETVITCTVPFDLRSVKSFTSLRSYCRRFKKGFAAIAAPFYKPTGKDILFQ